MLRYLLNLNNEKTTQEFILNIFYFNIADFHKEQERRMETIIRENEPVDLGDDVIKCKSYDGFLKFNIKSLDLSFISSCHIASSNIFIPYKIRFLIF